METKNAIIESTMLGYEDHGIMTYFLHLNYGGSGQGFGGYTLDEYNETLKERIPTAIAGKTIKAILETVGVDKWEDLQGKNIRVVSEFTKVHKIGNLLKDKWFDPKELV